MGRAIDDLGLVLGVIAGPDDVDPLVGPAPLGDHRSVSIDGLRIGVYTHDGVTEATPATIAAVERAPRRWLRQVRASKRRNRRRSTRSPISRSA